MNAGPSAKDTRSDILDVVNSAARQLGLVAPFALTCAYVGITAGSTTDEMLLTGMRLRLPLFSVDVSFDLFFAISGILIVVLHAYLMMQHRVLAERITAAEAQLGDISDQVRWQLIFPSLPVVRRDPRRHGRWTGGAARLFYFLAMTSPLALLAFMQWQIVPSHVGWLLGLFRALIIADAALILHAWPARPGSPPRWKSVTYWIGVIVSIFLVTLAFMGLRAPDERCRLPDQPFFVPDSWWQGLERNASLDLVGAELSSLEPGSPRLRLDHRDLRCADLRGAALPRALLRGANLQGADLTGADLRFADLSSHPPPGDPQALAWGQDRGGDPQDGGAQEPRGLTDLTGATLDRARLDGSRMTLARADRIRAREASFLAADMVGTQLRGADLTGADLRAVNLSSARLDEARLDFSRLTAAQLLNVSALGASFLATEAALTVWDHGDLRTGRFLGSDFQGASLVGTAVQAALFHDVDLRGVDGLRLEGVLLPRARISPDVFCGDDPVPVPLAPIADLRGWTADPVDRQRISNQLAALRKEVMGSLATTDFGTLDKAEDRLRRSAPGLQPTETSGAPSADTCAADPDTGLTAPLTLGCRGRTADLGNEPRVLQQIIDSLVANELEPAQGIARTRPRDWKNPPLLCTLLRYSVEENGYGTALRRSIVRTLEKRNLGEWIEAYPLRSAVAVPRQPLTLELEGQSLTCYW